VRIGLNAESDPARYLGNGWARPQPRHCWAVGQQSWIMLPSPPITGACLLTLTGWPALQPGLCDSQRVSVRVNGFPVDDFQMTGKHSRVIAVARHIVAGRDAICIHLLHPNAGQGADAPAPANPHRRALAVAYEAITIEELDDATSEQAARIRAAIKTPHSIAPPEPLAEDQRRAIAADILPDFQSFGDDCEFGFLQRRLGREAIGIFRFTSISIADLTRGINAGFDGIGDPDNFEIVRYEKAPAHDYMGRERRYGLFYHTTRRPDEISADALHAQEIRRLKFLARNLIDDIQAGGHIFVIKRKAAILPEEIARLLIAVRKLGAATILWVAEAGPQNPAGSVRWLAPGLLLGHVDRIDISPLQNISVSSWFDVCCLAHQLWRANKLSCAHAELPS
jgi:hypothetical protein